MTPEELTELANAIGNKILLTQKEVWTVDEVAAYTGLKKSYLYKLTSMRQIPHYKPSGKTCFFRREEIEAWLTANPIATNDELDELVTVILSGHSPAPHQRVGRMG